MGEIVPLDIQEADPACEFTSYRLSRFRRYPVLLAIRVYEAPPVFMEESVERSDF